tara:strand:- start:18741 stop:19784 length:1044 start_codon:yes stop_codon:yes gene_type:complete
MSLPIKKLLIKKNSSLTDALRQLGKTGLRCLIVIDNKNKYLGTITDGDIRREILVNKDFRKKINNVYNSKSTFLTTSNFNKSTANKLIEKKSLALIPIIDKNFKVVDYYNSFNSPHGIEEKNLVIVMAGGQGKRLQPFTSVLPKPLIPVKGKPVIIHIMNLFKSNRLNNFLISINKKSTVLKSYLNDLKSNYEFNFIEEKTPLGTAGALKKLPQLKKPFFIVNCDNLFKINPKDLLNFHSENKNILTLVASIKNFNIPYGVCTLDKKKGRLLKMEEKPSQSVLANTGFYVCAPNILNYLPKKNRFGMNDLINALQKRRKKIGVFPIKDVEWQDTGNWPDYMKTILRK